MVHDSGAAGLGHRRRMEALAVAFRRRQLTASIEPLADRVAGDIVVVDSYQRRADAGFIVAALTVAVDDLERNLAVDLVVDPSPGTPVQAHDRATVALVGARYALIGPGLPDEPPATSETVRRVLVTLGGHDPAGRAWQVAAELAAARNDVDVVSTGGPRHAADRRGVGLVETTGGLGEALADSDLTICAGGVTLLESLVLGRPTVVVVVAGNQERAAHAVVEAGAGVLATPDTAAAVAASLIDDREGRSSLRRAAMGLVDRSGPDRVVDSALDLLESVA